GEGTNMKKKIPPAGIILAAMVIGVVIGYAIHIGFPDKKSAAEIAGYVAIFSDVFLRLIKMLIGPLVFSTLVVGIAHLGDAASIGRVFAKALAWFIAASLVSLMLGLIFANLLQPGHNLGLPLPEIGASTNLAPDAVFAAMAATVAVNGLEILIKFAIFMGDFYLGLFVLWSVLIFAGFTVLGPRIFRLLALIKEAFMLSFATASSEAAYPKILDALDRFGVKRKISSFVMPMGYSFNLAGSMMYCTFAVLFIAQAYNILLPLGTQITMMLILMLTSKGMAGVPRASLVVIAATLNQFNIPEAGLLLILGVDTF